MALVEEEEEKVIIVIIPVTEKYGVPEIVQVPISSEEDLTFFCQVHEGYLKNSANMTATYKNIETDGVYTFYGSFYSAIDNESRRRQLDAKVLECESVLAVKKELGPFAHIHRHVVLLDENGNRTMELDAVVHLEEENVPGSTACIVECSFSPRLGEVQRLSEKADRFLKFAKRDKHFGSVTSVVQVLAGRHWTNETLLAASAANQWTVQPSGARYDVVRVLQNRTAGEMG